MRVARLTISNFRSIRSAELYFDDHVLFVGPNNVGKSTICEALDLVLGPDRLSRFPPVEEFDFYNAEYSATEDSPEAPSIRIEAVLTDLTPEVESACFNHLEFWRTAERRTLEQGEATAASPPAVTSCLRLETVARYNADEDEFEAETYFSHSPDSVDGTLRPVRRNIRRLFGFLYLRALRTGSRALSLERGSLLDIILRLQGVRTGLWRRAIERLHDLDPPIDQDATDLTPVLESIERRLASYIPVDTTGRATRLFVSQLTREHLRKTMAFFIALSPDQKHVPFQEAGSGTLNALVLALLSFIAEIKRDNVIFAMEEPEIALPPHTQRRIADYLLRETTQAFVTSHSPYVIERFEPSQVMVLRRDADAQLMGTIVAVATGLPPNTYRRFARRGLAESMLGKAVVVVEGITELSVLSSVARRMEAGNPELFPLDLAGVTLFDANGDGQMPLFGRFFRALGLRTFSFYDYKPRPAAQKQAFVLAFDIDYELSYPSMEILIATELSVELQWQFLEQLRSNGESGNVGIPAQRPTDDGIRELTKKALGSNKGAGWAARLLEACSLADLPASVSTFLRGIYLEFPRPAQTMRDPASPPTQ